MNGAGLEYDGYYSGASLNAVNVGATWQSSTVSDDIKESYSFGFNKGGTLSPQYSNGKILGRSVRCVRVQYISPDCNAERSRRAYYGRRP